MRISIIVPDNTICIAGEWHRSDCSALLAQGIHAVQWDGKHGEIEFVGHPKPNEPITSIERFGHILNNAIPYRANEPELTPDQRRSFDPERNVFLDGDGKVVEPLPGFTPLRPSSNDNN